MSFLPLFPFLKSLSSSPGRAVRKPSRLPARRFRPWLEALEGRSAPAVFPVTTLADSGAGTLRQAILDANTMAGDDTIDLQVTGTINLAGALPDLITNMDIQGPGANLLTVRRNTGGFYRIFTVASGAAVGISGLTIAYGCPTGSGSGVFNRGSLTLANSMVTNNSVYDELGGSGGGIANTGVLTISHSTISGNDGHGSGGGIANGGTLTIINSTVSHNSAVGGGKVLGSGGGIANAGTLRVSHSTISQNRGSDEGGPGGVWTFGSMAARNTIIAGNTAGPFAWDLSGNLGSLGYNLIGNSSGGTGFAPTDLLNVDPLLGPLQDNGGPTWTHALMPGSPALDAGDNTDAPDFDQRGLARVVAGTIDIGAVEVQVGPVASFYLFPDAGLVEPGVPFDLYVFALDAYGHVVTDYAGEVRFYSPDESAALPEPYTFRPEDGGVAYLPAAVAFSTFGPQELYVFDAATATVFGFAFFTDTEPDGDGAP